LGFDQLQGLEKERKGTDSSLNQECVHVELPEMMLQELYFQYPNFDNIESKYTS
jgi:hypothetical protein